MHSFAQATYANMSKLYWHHCLGFTRLRFWKSRPYPKRHVGGWLSRKLMLCFFNLLTQSRFACPAEAFHHFVVHHDCLFAAI